MRWWRWWVTLPGDGADGRGAGLEVEGPGGRLQGGESGGKLRRYQLNRRSIEISAGIAESLERTRVETGGQRRNQSSATSQGDRESTQAITQAEEGVAVMVLLLVWASAWLARVTEQTQRINKR